MLVLPGTAFFLTIPDGTSLPTALPAIEREFRAHRAAVHGAVTAYAPAFTGLLLACGRAADLLLACGRAADLLGKRSAPVAQETAVPPVDRIVSDRTSA